jgi:hypothetical protein
MPGKDKVIKFNKCAYFLLPLAGINTCSYGEEAFKECYITRNKEIVLKLNLEEPAEIIAPVNHKETRKENGYTWMVYNIPFEFLDEYDAFMEGKYSAFSEEAFRKIRDSIPKEVHEFSKEEMEKLIAEKRVTQYIKKMHDSIHPVRILLKSGKTDMELNPNYLGAIAPDDHRSRKSLRDAYSKDFDFDIPEDVELYEKPDLEKEVIEL